MYHRNSFPTFMCMLHDCMGREKVGKSSHVGMDIVVASLNVHSWQNSCKKIVLVRVVYSMCPWPSLKHLNAPSHGFVGTEHANTVAVFPIWAQRTLWHS